MKEKIIAIYPQLKDVDFLSVGIFLQNDSDEQGTYIKEWKHSTLPEPTDEQLKGV